MLAFLISVFLLSAFVQANTTPALALDRVQQTLSDDVYQLLISDAPTATSSCGVNGPASCQGGNTTASCCYESPGGLLAHVQFWDANPATGPPTNWTIHGLWPDHCNGTYKASCDKSRNYTDLGSIFDQAGRPDLGNFLSTWMLSNDERRADRPIALQNSNGHPQKFWEHEWDHHGTCVNTLSPNCLPPGSPRGTEAVYYFSQIATLFQNQTTYEWLARHNIIPSVNETFTLEQFTSAIQAEWGHIPALQCQNGAIFEIYYYYNLKGSMIDGEFVSIDAPNSGNCLGSFHYLPKNE
ncbi:ribonuclease T2 [Clavulina sp. PMI_390]|nr:ribonuclease T2 [Clavulina sp. PMI_390]